MNPVVNLFGSAVAVLALVAIPWFIWKTWQSGVREAEAYERDDWVEEGRCGKCGYDLRAAPGRCPECGHDPGGANEVEGREGELDPHTLRDDWPTTPIKARVPAPGETPVVVYATRNGFEADLLVQQLQVRGVLCSADKRRDSILSGAVVYNVVQHCVACASGDEKRAREIIDSFRVRRKPADPSASRPVRDVATNTEEDR